jgi:hypothetical protein
MFSTKSNPEHLNVDLHRITLYNLKTRRWQTFRKWVIRLSLLLIIILSAIFYGRYSLYLEQETKRNNEIAIWLEQCEAFHSRDAIKPAIACYKEVLKRDRHHPLAFQNLKVLENQYVQEQSRLIAEMQLSENLDNEPLTPLFVQFEQNEHALDNLEDTAVVAEWEIATTIPLSFDNAIPETIQRVQDNELPTHVQVEKTEHVHDKLDEKPVVPKQAVATVPIIAENQTSVPATTVPFTTDNPISETIEGPDNEPPTPLTVQVEKTEHVHDKLDERPVVAESVVATGRDENQTDETEPSTTANKTDDNPISETVESVLPDLDNEPHTEAIALAESDAADSQEGVIMILSPISTITFQGHEDQATEQTVQPDNLPRGMPVSTQLIEKTALGPDNVENQAQAVNKGDNLLSKKDDNHKSIHLESISSPLSVSAFGIQDKVPDNVVVSENSEPSQSAPLISKESEPNQENQAEKSSALDMLLNIAASIHNESTKADQVAKPLDDQLPAYSEKPRDSKPVLAKSEPKSPRKEATPKTTRITALLQKCETHFDENRLTTGEPGTAFQCYRQVLALDAHNAQAIQGLMKIEGRYQSWAKQALKKGKRNSAEQYIQRLQKVNALSPALPKLQQSLSRLERQAVTQLPSKPRIKTSMPPSKPPLKTSQQSAKPRQSQPPAKQRINTSIQPPVKDGRHKATYQAAHSPSPFKLQCGDILAQESLGIRPLTQEQKAFKRQYCY